ncbi:MAG: tRNA pseudouridine(38-40) synthase TruA [Saprospiraceae bacterium]|jgi:tRNA pseudouridine38-40 synthase|nr:tRNA pseudouridine(38-40) synthase TruA [Saprospiraceae bacterium]MDG2419267.1 tRNA pseudouridine(38-40) synthase TruA [Saprospiraceae bacterium]
MRYFAELSYKGTNYNGWQRQPNAPTIQQTIETAFSLILRTPTQVMGCGRTDSGVHASQFFIHFEVEEIPRGFEKNFQRLFLNRVNKYLPTDITIHRLIEVAESAHVRFDAYYRAYEYHIIFEKNPFLAETAFRFSQGKKLDFDKMQAAAKLLLNYNEFFTFCKTKSDAKTMICIIKRSEWVWKKEGKHLVFHIAANRFLRGMVRLVVGMCLNVGMGKVSLDEVKEALDAQKRLKKSYSVPPNGLFLAQIKYPFSDADY